MLMVRLFAVADLSITSNFAQYVRMSQVGFLSATALINAIVFVSSI